MGRPLRIFDENTIYFVTNRCLEARFFLRPSQEVNDLILGWLARAASIYKVRILFFVFMSNHFHLGVRAPRENLDRFMGYFQSGLARNLNRHVLDRSGAVFERRYSAEPILDDAALLDKMVDTLNNPVRAGLVDRIEQWPGLSSFAAHISGEPIRARWLDRDRLRRMRRRKGHTPDLERQAYLDYEIALEPLPALARHTPTRRAARLRRLVEAGARRCRAARATEALGAHGVLAQKPHRRPRRPAFSPRPLCHASCGQRRDAYRRMTEQVTRSYRRAMRRWRRGESDVRFPRGTIPPGWTRCVGANEQVGGEPVERERPHRDEQRRRELEAFAATM